MKCHKRKYRDKLDATIALARLRAEDKPGHDEKRTYKCRCGYWHLTSMERYDVA